MSTTEDMIGRSDPNDVDAILAAELPDRGEAIHIVESNGDAIYTWDYNKGFRPQLDKLYEKAKHGQWNAQTDLPWDTIIDPLEEATLAYDAAQAENPLGLNIDLEGTGIENWGRDEWIQFNVEAQKWSMSQFMHGEQGALICTAKIVETVPWIDAKYYASTQVMDEARHVEVFAKYLDEKLDGIYPVNTHLQLLLDDIMADTRWDMTYLGMQIMVEGLALAAFGHMYHMTNEPLLKQLLRYVMSDEARHVAFGVLSLKEVYPQLTQAELRERQEFAFEAALRMRDRFLQQDVWIAMGADPKKVCPRILNNPDRLEFQKMLFTKIVPNCKKLGLLDAGDGWLRSRFEEIGVIQFENWKDTAEEVDSFAILDQLEAGAAAAG